MEEEEEVAKLYTCFQATNRLGEPVYMIYSAKLSDLQDNKVGSTPNFNLETVIKGLYSMGCGIFGSKIVLAGGDVTRGIGKRHPQGIITYDIKTKVVSHKEIPPMQGLKIRPLVFELYRRLYVFNTSTDLHRRSFEIYYPKLNMWDRLSFPGYRLLSLELFGYEEISGRNPFSWFVFGNCLYLSVPDFLTSAIGCDTYFHHARQVCKRFECIYSEHLPFSGMATTYWHPDFSDLVVISISQDHVVGRRLINPTPYFGEPKKLFPIDCYKPDGERSHYFADFGHGNFCLTTFNDVSIHVYVFTIDRKPDDQNGALNINLTRLFNHKYNTSDISLEGNEIDCFLGCFALPTDDRKKRVEEAKLYFNHFSYFEENETDDDLPLPKASEPVYEKIKEWVDEIESDSDVEVYG